MPETVITSETLIPIGMVIGAVIAFVAAVARAVTMYNDIAYLKRDLIELKTGMAKEISDIKTDIKEVKQLLLDQK